MLPDNDLTVQQPQEALDSQAAPPRASAMGGRIARAALILMAGTILSRVLGLGREVTIAHLFGARAEVDAFTIANHVATIVYDLLIAGTVSAALVPTFSEYAEGTERRAEFGRVVSTILTVAAFFLVGSVALLELFAQPLVSFMCAGCAPAKLALALEMTQWVLPGVLFMGLSGVVMAAHYALGRFTYPAFTSALFNASIIFCAFTLSGALDIKALVVGMVAGAFAMLAMQTPGLRDVVIRPTLDLRHPAVRKIFQLYAPVGLSVIISSAALVIDRNLASQVGDGAISAMRYATTLVQFAMGFVAAAISLAALPSLSQHHSRGDQDAFMRTLAAGLRMVWVMSLPAAAALLALATPIVSLLFNHGEFNSSDQELTVLALLFYVPGLPFGAVDQVLIFAFYARKNTWTPVLVGIAAIGVYLIVALSLISSMGMAGLVLANTAQLTFHAIATGILLWREMQTEGGLSGHGIGQTALKALGAAGAMALISFGTWQVLHSTLPQDNFVFEAITLGVPALLGGGLYLALVWMMRLPEIELVAGKVASRLGRSRS